MMGGSIPPPIQKLSCYQMHQFQDFPDHEAVLEVIAKVLWVSHACARAQVCSDNNMVYSIYALKSLWTMHEQGLF